MRGAPREQKMGNVVKSPLSLLIPNDPEPPNPGKQLGVSENFISRAQEEFYKLPACK